MTKILKGTLTLALSKFMHHVYCKQYFMYRKFKGKTLSLTLPRLSAFCEHEGMQIVCTVSTYQAL